MGTSESVVVLDDRSREVEVVAASRSAKLKPLKSPLPHPRGDHWRTSIPTSAVPQCIPVRATARTLAAIPKPFIVFPPLLRNLSVCSAGIGFAAMAAVPRRRSMSSSQPPPS